jgi:hypothetical protein
MPLLLGCVLCRHFNDALAPLTCGRSLKHTGGSIFRRRLVVTRTVAAERQ